VDSFQAIFGNLLLLLAELAAISFAVIVLLLQANLIVQLGKRLTRRTRHRDLDGTPSRKSYADQSSVAGVPEEKEG
jgi:hypothetical protein